MNKLLLMGRLTADPEFSQTQSGIAVCKFKLAVDRQYSKGEEKTADSFQLVAFGKTAEFVNKFFIKGKPILVEGRIQNNNYQGQNGKMQYHNQIIADNVSFTLADPTRQQNQPQQGYQQNPAQVQQNQPQQNTQVDLSEYEQISDGQLPF